MRHHFSTVLFLAFFAVSCKKTNPSFVIPDGTYTGTFQRQTSMGGQISNVTITFSGSNWTGQSQFVKYPALCHGTYNAKGINSIAFQNACPWTAEFDWTLILSYDYKIKVVGKGIEISRNYNSSFKDVYKLTKQ
jgi:hypothetical protein